MQLLSTEEVADYWNKRHITEGELLSGGDMSFDEATNEMFYVHRLGILLDLIGHQSSLVAPRFVLDAGCGKGWFSQQLALFGHCVESIDGSASAIAHCRDRYGLRAFQSTLAAWRSAWLYDLVISIDVVFHITDEREWELSMRNLASLVRFQGRLIVTDWGESGDHAYGNYQLVRGRERYLPLMARCGLRFDGWRPYDFRISPIGFYVFTRTG